MPLSAAYTPRTRRRARGRRRWTRRVRVRSSESGSFVLRGQRKHWCFLHRAQHDRRAGATDARHRLELITDDAIEIARTSAAHLEQVVVVAGDMVALLHLFERLDFLQESGTVHGPLERDGDEGGEDRADGLRVDEGGVAADEPALLKAF